MWLEQRGKGVALIWTIRVGPKPKTKGVRDVMQRRRHAMYFLAQSPLACPRSALTRPLLSFLRHPRYGTSGSTTVAVWAAPRTQLRGPFFCNHLFAAISAGARQAAWLHAAAFALAMFRVIVSACIARRQPRVARPCLCRPGWFFGWVLKEWRAL